MYLSRVLIVNSENIPILFLNKTTVAFRMSIINR